MRYGGVLQKLYKICNGNFVISCEVITWLQCEQFSFDFIMLANEILELIV
jgi:hypothetical protein